MKREEFISVLIDMFKKYEKTVSKKPSETFQYINNALSNIDHNSLEDDLEKELFAEMTDVLSNVRAKGPTMNDDLKCYLVLSKTYHYFYNENIRPLVKKEKVLKFLYL